MAQENRALDVFLAGRVFTEELDLYKWNGIWETGLGSLLDSRQRSTGGHMAVSVGSKQLAQSCQYRDIC